MAPIYFYIMHVRFQLEPVFHFMLCIYVTEIDADIFALCFFPFRYFCLLFAVGHCFGYNAYPIDDFRGACAVKGNVQVAGRTSSVSTTEMLSTHDVTLRNVDGSLFHVQI